MAVRSAASPIPERVWLEKKLSDPDYQRAARIKIWREVGVELDEAKGRTIKTPQAITTEETEAEVLQLNNFLIRLIEINARRVGNSLRETKTCISDFTFSYGRRRLTVASARSNRSIALGSGGQALIQVVSGIISGATPTSTKLASIAK